MTREQHQSCLEKQRKLNLLRHGCDVAPFFAAADNQFGGALPRLAQLDAFRKAKTPSHRAVSAASTPAPCDIRGRP
jgi:hypothetical protein